MIIDIPPIEYLCYNDVNIVLLLYSVQVYSNIYCSLNIFATLVKLQARLQGSVGKANTR